MSSNKKNSIFTTYSYTGTFTKCASFSFASQKVVDNCRQEVEDVLDGKSSKIIVVTGPCSIHDPSLVLNTLFKISNILYQDDLVIVMRTYFSKPRTTVGWNTLSMTHI